MWFTVPFVDGMSMFQSDLANLGSMPGKAFRFPYAIPNPLVKIDSVNEHDQNLFSP